MLEQIDFMYWQMILRSDTDKALLMSFTHSSGDVSEIDFAGLFLALLFYDSFELQLLFADVLNEPKSPLIRPEHQIEIEVVVSRLWEVPGEEDLDCVFAAVNYSAEFDSQ